MAVMSAERLLGADNGGVLIGPAARIDEREPE
jgi:hypothetical protein